MALYRILKKDGNLLTDNGCRYADTLEELRTDFPLPWFLILDSELTGVDLSLKDVVNNALVNATAAVLTERNKIKKERLASEAKQKRDGLMAETTEFMTIDNPFVTLAERDKLVVYRQALREIETQSGFPETIVWPVKP